MANNQQLLELIKTLDCFIQDSSIGMYFRPLDSRNIHGTIIGLEKTNEPANQFNLNLFNQFGIKRQMDFEKAIELIKEYLPVSIRFGGFSPSFDSFASWGERPYISSFQLFSRGPDATIIGWPYAQGDFSGKVLLRIREALEKSCNIRHKYAKELDNGFFINLGKFSSDDLENAHISGKTMIESNELIEVARDYLFHHPIDVTLDCNNIKIVQYKKVAQGRINITGDLRLTDTALSNEVIQRLY